MCRRLLFGLVLCGFFANVAAFAQASNTPSQALLEDAASYAADNGVSLDEAVRRLRLQVEAGLLDEMLRNQEAGSFAGLWIEHEPQYRVVVRFQDPSSEGRLRARIAGTPLEGLVEALPAAVALAQLEERRSAALQRVRQVRFAVDSDINVKENRVEVYTDRPQALRAALATARVTLPERVEIVAVPRLAEPLVLRGGDAGSSCTGGFTVRHNYSGHVGISTAAHCGNTQYFQGLWLPFQSEDQQGNQDVQWHSACGYIDVSNEFNSGIGYRACIGTRHRDQQAIGSYVCKWGMTTGRSCGYIQTKSYSISYVSSSASTFVRVDGGYTDLSGPGDSGGPWFVEDIAYGINSGSPGSDPNDALYMPINYISSLGVSVLTYDPGSGCGLPPVASFTWAASGTWVDFNASGSYDPDGSIVGYFWDFGDGTTGSGSMLSHVFPYESTFLVTLTVTDNSGRTSQSSQYVNASSDPCGGDPCCGDPCCGDPCCGDPCCGTYCCGRPYCQEP